MDDYEKEERKWRDEWWRRERERRVRQHLIREGKAPNFIMTDGESHPDESMPPYPRRKRINIFQQLIGVFLVIAIVAIARWLR